MVMWFIHFYSNGICRKLLFTDRFCFSDICEEANLHDFFKKNQSRRKNLYGSFCTIKSNYY